VGADRPVRHHHRRVAGPGASRGLLPGPVGALTVSAELVARLRAAGCVFAEDEAQLLTTAARSADELEALAARRIAGEPLEYLLGWVEFAGLRLAVEPGVFVPRQRTRLLAAEALRVLPAGGVVVELCCGVGAVGAALLAARPDIELHAADIAPVAVRCARRNLGSRASVHAGDLYGALPASLRGRVDLLVANAPYVPSEAIALMPPEARLHEPRVALDGGPDGLDVHRRIAADAPGWLVPGVGHLIIETSRVQGPRTAELASRAGLRARIVRDEDLDATAVVAVLP
jgi:release factor glutamine methyltransferase